MTTPPDPRLRWQKRIQINDYPGKIHSYTRDALPGERGAKVVVQVVDDPGPFVPMLPTDEIEWSEIGRCEFFRWVDCTEDEATVHAASGGDTRQRSAT